MSVCLYKRLKRFSVLILVILFLIVTLIGIETTKTSRVIGETKKSFVEYNFENRFIAPFKASGKSMSLRIDNTTAAEGTFSLLASGRKQIDDGILLDVTNLIDYANEYKITLYVYHKSSKMQRFVVSSEIETKSGKENKLLCEKIIIPKSWKKLDANLNLTEQKGIKKVWLKVYVPTSTTNFYVDLFTLKVADKSHLIKFENFEDKSIAGFISQDKKCKLSISKEKAYQGTYSIKVQQTVKRQNTTVILPVKGTFEKGKSYSISFYMHQSILKSLNFAVGIRFLESGKNMREIVLGRVTIPKNKWTEVFASYTPSLDSKIKDFVIFIRPLSDISYYYIDNFTISDDGWYSAVPDLDLPSLREKYKNYFKIGVAVPYRALTNPVDVAFIKRHFNSITAENEMKPEALEPIEDNFNFSIADEYLNFCRKNNIAIRGHTLVWHQQTPNWFFENPQTGKKLTNSEKDKKILLERLKKYIQTVVSRYKGRIYAWDVVNEAIDENEPDGFRRSDWFNVLGPEYIEKAFIYAHQADPNAQLFYNDYSTENPVKREYIYKLIKSLREKGIPIHGVGLQCHISVSWPSVEEVEKTIKLFSSIPGIKIHVTEIDISVAKEYGEDIDEETKRYLLIQQARKLKDLFDVFKKYKNVVTSVSFWGLKDDYSWLQGDFPLLFDKDYQPKFAFWSLIDPSVVPEE
ncbi:endo-1,4-beta-xylanase [Caldicellulosiruptor bescii]|uniref:Beta-xylanase n=2 Tax=Caldicellulosiruptor bescii TaxID=31899 RepID=B9MPI1_CALBD|nr:endo-1,4-beta-xylanase [Caldicellulosiruptor bescii]ACM59742.1 Endo-1,4-beta-xylanase [Caldicellulosiruptor bescii DSM 6725]PBC87151.1 endo-1,4-beta-xylanase [Caldicellulosiruptor bescii]PBC90090.1 endo-1,4-beta-xylanase [Caldicellulosiruptor bescii]PBD04479.1 endo-1,4-beta-xylanase [Caldicellulosiruptor bescii]PBD05887.1 endo-1,4-beta-xylanase [Caldicellulosiruptor bescii]